MVTAIKKINEQQATQRSVMMPRVVLLVVADYYIREAISYGLRGAGYFVVAVADQTLALDIIRDNPLSLVVLDTLHFQGNLLAFYQQMRTHVAPEFLPIVLIISHDDEIARLESQSIHADDYLVGPFRLEELRASVGALLRSHKRNGQKRPIRLSPKWQESVPQKETEILLINTLCIDTARRTVTWQGKQIELGQAVLFDLLVYFVRHPGIVLTRDRLLRQVWGYDATTPPVNESRTVDVHIHWLRELLGDTSENPQLIQTIRGVGYRMKNDERSHVPSEE